MKSPVDLMVLSQITYRDIRAAYDVYTPYMGFANNNKHGTHIAIGNVSW